MFELRVAGAEAIAFFSGVAVDHDSPQALKVRIVSDHGRASQHGLAKLTKTYQNDLYDALLVRSNPDVVERTIIEHQASTVVECVEHGDPGRRTARSEGSPATERSSKLRIRDMDKSVQLGGAGSVLPGQLDGVETNGNVSLVVFGGREQITRSTNPSLVQGGGWAGLQHCCARLNRFGRGGDFIGVWTPTLLGLLAIPSTFVAVLLAGAWTGAGLWLGRLSSARTSER